MLKALHSRSIPMRIKLRLLVSALLCSLIAVFALTIFAFWPQVALRIDVAKQTCYLKTSIFELSWIHSVEQTPWIETYRVTSSELILVKSAFKSFGAGVPHTGQLIHDRTGYITYEVTRPIKILNWLASARTQLALHLKTATWEISNPLTDYTQVRFSATKKSRWQRLWRPSCPLIPD